MDVTLPTHVVQSRTSLLHTECFCSGSRWPEGLSLRTRRQGDAAQLFALLTQVDFERNASTLDPFAIVEDVVAFFQSLPAGCCEVVADLNGEIVGHALVCPSLGRQKHTGTLTLTVHEAHQRRGIGAALMTCLITTAWVMMGLTRLQLTVFVDNVRAVSLYKRFGFMTEGRIRSFVERPDGFMDAYLMALMHPYLGCTRQL